MELKLIIIDSTALTVFEIPFLNSIFSKFLNWEPGAFTFVKIKFPDGQEKLVIDAPTDMIVGNVLMYVGLVEDFVRSMTLGQIIRAIDDAEYLKYVISHKNDQSSKEHIYSMKTQFNNLMVRMEKHIPFEESEIRQIADSINVEINKLINK